MALLASTTLCLLLAGGSGAATPPSSPAPQAAQPAREGWELVGSWKWLRMVYVEPARIKDTKLLAGVVRTLLEQAGTATPLQIDFFDDRASTPTAKPWNAQNVRHHRAKFNFNPGNGMRRFAWVEYVPVDPNVPTRVKAVETEASLPSP